MTDEGLRHIERMAEAATPGPWTHRSEKLHNGKHHIAGRGPVVVIGGVEMKVPRNSSADGLNKQAEANAAFIASARYAVPALIQEIRRLRAAPAQ